MVTLLSETSCTAKKGSSVEFIVGGINRRCTRHDCHNELYEQAQINPRQEAAVSVSALPILMARHISDETKRGIGVYVLRRRVAAGFTNFNGNHPPAFGICVAVQCNR